MKGILVAKGQLPSGSDYAETRCGTFRLVKSEWCDGVRMPIEWKVWRWKRGTWHPVAAFFSFKRAEKFIKASLTQLDEEE